MRWEEVRKLHPNSFVKISILESYVIDDSEYVLDLYLHYVIENSSDVFNELKRCNTKQIVYSTYHEDLVIKTSMCYGFRRKIK